MNDKINFSFNTDERYLPYEENLTRGFWGGIAALVLFFLVVPTALILSLRPFLAGAELLVAVSMVSQLGLGAMLLFLLRGRKPLREVLELGEWKDSYLVAGLAAAAVFSFAVMIVQTVYTWIGGLFGVDMNTKSHVEEMVQAMDWQGLLALGGAAILVAPVVEEILFRRVIFGYLAKRTSWVVSLAITSVAFGAVHGEIKNLPGLILLGVGFQLVYLWQKSLYPAIIMHFANNVFVVTIMVLLKYNVIR